MGLLDSLFGTSEESVLTEDEAVATPLLQEAEPVLNRPLDRYHFMLKIAPPEVLERAHLASFQELTDEEKHSVSQQLNLATPLQSEASTSESAKSLGHVATQVELDQPGEMERLFGGANLMGSVMGSSSSTLLEKIAIGFVNSAAGREFFSNPSIEEAFENSPAPNGSASGWAEERPRERDNTLETPPRNQYGDSPGFDHGDSVIAATSGDF